MPSGYLGGNAKQVFELVSAEFRAEAQAEKAHFGSPVGGW
jgi:hypothetical protein